MTKLLLLLLFALPPSPALSQIATIRIVAPKALNERRAILLTREREFAAIVHSIKLGFDTTHLQMTQDLLPDRYQLQISGIRGALTFFFEPGTEIIVDTADITKSLVRHSRSHGEWRTFQDSIQTPSEQRLDQYTLEEARARKRAKSDSAAYWVAMQTAERNGQMAAIRRFIAANPQSYVSLYLLKNHWYALKNDGLFPKLSVSMAHHRNYRFLKSKSPGEAKLSR